MEEGRGGGGCLRGGPLPPGTRRTPRGVRSGVRGPSEGLCGGTTEEEEKDASRSRGGGPAPPGPHRPSPARPAKSSATSVPAPPSSPPLLLLLGLLILSAASEGRSNDEDSHDGAAVQKNWRITCYTCVNVSNNEECNRFAIDRPCPEGGDYCLTLHVMDALDRERSVLVNKRCASLEDCAGDSTGCTTTFGQTQCVSCCDQSYCNDPVPSNSTNAVFHRSTASAVVVRGRRWGLAWTVVTAALLLPAVHVLALGGPS